MIRYQDAGVSIDEADRAVSSVKKLARATFTRNVLTDIGSFGACYALSGWKKPVLISSADGVGTKLKVAFLTGRHDTVGEDLVNHCVNDIAVLGAEPRLKQSSGKRRPTPSPASARPDSPSLPTCRNLSAIAH